MMKDIDPAWHNRQIEQYAQVLPRYATYAAVLEDILKAVCRVHAPLAIVQSRPKTLSSFAEKAVRRYPGLMDPVRQLNDLCCARVIAQTQTEVDRISQFIRDHLVIDVANSEDKRGELGTSSFGYLAMHFVVQLPRLESGRIMGVKLPEDLVRAGFKAEIQVKTMLQHAWASISHDSLYKNMFQPPEEWYREMSRLAAALEEADAAFVRFVGRLDDYAANHGAYLPGAGRQVEIDTLALILDKEPDAAQKPGHALRIAAIHKASGEWPQVVKTLMPFADGAPARLERELGHALCRANRCEPRGAPYQDGIARLERALSHDPLDAETHSRLAWALIHSGLPENETRAQAHLARAYEQKPSNPYYLNAFLETRILHHDALDHVSLMQPALLKAIDVCHAHAQAGMEIPAAYFTMGRLLMLLNRTHESLHAYLKGLRLCLCEHEQAQAEKPRDELDFLHRLGRIRRDRADLSGQEVCLRLLIVASFIKACRRNVDQCRSRADPSDVKARAEKLLRELATSGTERQGGPVLILTGSCASSEENAVQAYRDALLPAFRHYHGRIFSGGTLTGIGKLAGDLAEQVPHGEARSMDVVGYLPGRIPHEVRRDHRYTRHVVTAGQDFSPLEPLQMWIDLLAGGGDPRRVKLIGIGGGAISAFEYRLALLLGAQVGIFQNSGRAADAVLEDAHWAACPNLVRLINDPMTVNAFVAEPRLTLEPERIETMAEQAHEAYRQERLKMPSDLIYRAEPNLKPWPDLDPGLQESNRRQIVFSVEILRQNGFLLEPAHEVFADPAFTLAEIELMAEMEHGRWNLERTQEGWRYGETKDLAARISPYLVAWNHLSDDIKEFDREAVRKWPRQLWEAGLRVVRSA